MKYVKQATSEGRETGSCCLMGTGFLMDDENILEIVVMVVQQCNDNKCL
jgi:hypothetical protein